ncbi:helix-hairpin-helix domain-containing protein [Microcoleus sp.]|uniref:helix-hairpin-helix domain-containing protein n=1 Tax=Microcoleus sp. TaxID=44472 RepID=UPI0035231FBD
MTKLQRYKTGQIIELIETISHGGQGEIWKTNKNGFVAKIYSSVDSILVEKLQVMVDNPPEDTMRKKGHVSIAWPEDLLRDSNEKFVGFIMPEIGNGQTLINVYNPSQRENVAPGFNWLYLHITALNVAIIIEAIHAKNYIVGDIKPENLLVNSRALVSIVDTDSFQIRHPQIKKNCPSSVSFQIRHPQIEKIYRCPVGSEEYTPPELIGKDFKTIDRLEIHDCFGLGVIIYHLLFGYHPYDGIDKSGGKPTNLNERISKTSWPHAPNSPISPSMISIPLDIVHPKIQTCFHRCFTVGSENPHLRPSAKEWRDALEVAIADLTDCSNETGHQYAKTYGKCYWCERKLEIGGYDIFPTVPDSSKYTVTAFRASLKVNQSTPLADQPKTSVTLQPPRKVYPREPIKKHSSPIVQWITVTAVTLASLVGIPPIRENITLPVINRLIQIIHK